MRKALLGASSCLIIVGSIGVATVKDPAHKPALFSKVSNTLSDGSEMTTSTTVQTGAPTTTQSLAPIGSEFRDPQGVYTMQIGADWVRQPGMVVAEVEDWSVASIVDGFLPNVNVLVQEFPPDSLRQYLDLSEQSLPDGVDGKGTIIDLPDGSKIGRFTMHGYPKSELSSVGYVRVEHGQAILATFVAPEKAFDELAAQIEPYLKTLHFASVV